MTRTSTPDRTNGDGSTTITMQRACNGCGALLGDVTDEEIGRVIAGLPMPDVRRECPACAPAAPEPRCIPARTVYGDADCLNGDADCGHDIALDAEYCVAVRAEYACATHSDIANDGQITRAERWPCKHLKVNR